jgi:hypothetical protein
VEDEIFSLTRKINNLAILFTTIRKEMSQILIHCGKFSLAVLEKNQVKEAIRKLEAKRLELIDLVQEEKLSKENLNSLLSILSEPFYMGDRKSILWHGQQITGTIFDDQESIFSFADIIFCILEYIKIFQIERQPSIHNKKFKRVDTVTLNEKLLNLFILNASALTKPS